MAVIEWPSEHFRLKMTSYHVDWTNRSAGVGLSGHEQIISSGTGRWRLEFSLVIEPDHMRLKRFEALVSQMRGRYNSALIPLFDALAYDDQVSPRQIPYSDGTWHTDGRGWAASGIEPLLVTSGGAAGGTGFFVGLTEPLRPRLRVGDLFTFNGWLHRVVETFASGFVRVEPPLRADLPVGTALETHPIKVRAKFATDGEGERARGLLSYGEPVSLTFVEDFDR